MCANCEGKVISKLRSFQCQIVSGWLTGDIGQTGGGPLTFV